MEKNDRIERYLLGELSPDERRAFEDRLAEDPGLAAELKLQRELMAAVRNDEAAAFRARLKTLRHRCSALADDPPAPPPTRRFALRPFLLIAASVALLLVAAYFFMHRPSTAADVYAYAEEQGLPIYPAELFPEAIARREAGEEMTSPFALSVLEIQQNYDRAEFQEALAALNALPVGRIGAGRYHYYRGVLEWRDGQNEAALASFASVGGDATFRNPALWNYALLLVKLGKTTEAVAVFQELAGRNFQRTEAERMIRKLREVE